MKAPVLYSSGYHGYEKCLNGRNAWETILATKIEKRKPGLSNVKQGCQMV
jgi:hypothetical protein